jgi:hypothetical protein
VSELAPNPYDQPDLFDLPGDRRPRRIFLAYGQKWVKNAKGKKVRKTTTQWVNSPTPEIAERTARRYLSLFGHRLFMLHEHSWADYARDLAWGASGVKIEWRERKP